MFKAGETNQVDSVYLPQIFPNVIACTLKKIGADIWKLTGNFPCAE